MRRLFLLPFALAAASAQAQAPMKLYEARYPVELPAGSKLGGIDAVAPLAADQTVRSLMRDPAATQFRGVRVRPGETPERRVVCGEMNGKNQFGGYVGFAPFIAQVAPAPAPGGGWLVSEPMIAVASPAFQAAWRLHCG